MNKQYLYAGILMGFAFGLGRFTASEKIKTVTQIVTVDSKKDDTHTDKDAHETTTVVEVDKPDGTKTTTTTTKEDTDTKIDDKSTYIVDSTARTTTEKTVGSASALGVSFMMGANVSNLGTPVYGGSVNKKVLGPLTVGVWGLNSGVFGGSVGLEF